jgi:Icc-related predicted phosphoesterase
MKRKGLNYLLNFLLYPGVKWLDDELYTIDIRGYKLGIIGSRGVIDRPTYWQRKHIPNIEEIYSQRTEKLASLLETSKQRNDITILVTHYGVAQCTLIGEPRKAWPGIYSRKIEALLKKYKPNAAIHGHAHKGKPYCRVNGTPVYNVAFPVNRRPVKISYTMGLLGYLS